MVVVEEEERPEERRRDEEERRLARVNEGLGVSQAFTGRAIANHRR